MEKLRLFLAVSIFALLVAACGGGVSSTSITESPTQPVTVSLSDLSATVEISSTHQFSATVENADDTTVDWQVNNVTGGNSTVGTISESGLYTAPDRVPSPVTVTVTAVAHADATKEASATVTIMSNVTISVSPLSTSVEIGKTQQFTATVQNANDTSVEWQVNQVTGGNSTVGTISTSGLYTAPSQAPSPSTITITAVSLADPGVTASAAVTVTANIAISVSPLSATVEISQTQLFTATVQNSVDDSVDWQVNDVSGGNSTVGTISATGLYTAPDRVPTDSTVTVKAVANADPTMVASATVTITSNVALSISPEDAAIPAGQTQQFTATVQNSSDNTVTWQVNDVIGGNDKLGTITSAGLYTAPSLPPGGGAVMITAIPAADSSRTASVSATIQFSNASLSGPYVFDLAWHNLEVGPTHGVGRLVADGNGNIVSGVEDLRTAGLTMHMWITGGTYMVEPDGRGTLLLEGGAQPTQAKFELTNSGDGALLQFDNINILSGSGQIYKQDAGTFSNASMKGSYVMQFLGAEPSGTIAGVGVITSDGAGNLTGMQDMNTGEELLTKMSINGTYSVDLIGRATVTTVTGSDTSETVLYLISSDRAVGVPRPMGIEGSGSGFIQVERQRITNFSNASISGDYVYFATDDSLQQGDFALGRLTADGAGVISAGVEDNSYLGSVTQGATFTGSYSIPSTDMGRGTVSIITPEGPSGGGIFYLVSEKRAFTIGTDTSEPTAGQMIAQQGSPFSASSLQGTFVHSLRGFNFNFKVEVGKLGSLVLDGNGSLAGSQAANIGGFLVPNVALTGTYSVEANGRGQATLSDGTFEEHYVLYVVDSAHAYLLYTDPDAALFGRMITQFPAQQVPLVGLTF